jgi:hypothetical protein
MFICLSSFSSPSGIILSVDSFNFGIFLFDGTFFSSSGIFLIVGTFISSSGILIESYGLTIFS